MFRTLLKNRHFRLWAPIAFGILLIFLALGSPSTPKRIEAADRQLPVRVAAVVRQDYVPGIEGFGRVEPEREWTSVAQVQGPLSFVHEDLEVGAVLPRGTKVLEVDPSEYQYNVSKLEAELDEHLARQDGLDALFDIETKMLELEERDFERKKSLVDRGSASRGQLDEQERNLLNMRRDVEASRLEVETLRARLGIIEAELALARLNLSRTAAVLPFDARISHLNIERGEFVRVGDKLFTASSTDRVEVVAKFSSEDFIGLLPRSTDPRGGEPATFYEKDTEDRVASSGLSAKVSYAAGDYKVSWDGVIKRFTGDVDPVAGTVSVVIEIDQPSGRGTAGRSPLASGMLVDVLLSTRPFSNALVVPTDAVQNGHLALVDSDNRIEIRKADVWYSDSAFTVLRDDVAPDEQVVVSSFSLESDGMSVVLENNDAPRLASGDAE